jgi:phosphotriesterase-related protein
VRTILGDIAPSDLGVCYAHEHVVIDQSVALKRFPEYDLRHVDTIVAELQTLRAAGVRTMVDAMPGGGAGRQVRKLAEVSTRSGMQILCPTGLHLAKYYPDDHWSQSIPEKDLADVFVGEITDGIDVNDLATGTIARTAHRAGLIKVASGSGRLSDHETKCFRAAAAAHVRTGAPILTHTEQGTAAFEQIEIFQAGGVDLSRVVLSHCDRKPDVAYHREILSTGVKLEYDSAFRW